MKRGLNLFGSGLTGLIHRALLSSAFITVLVVGILYMIYQIGYGIGDRTKENSRIAQRIAWQINSDFRELKAGAEPQEITAGELVANAASRFHPEDKFDAPITKFIPEGHGEKLAREFELVEADGASTVIKITVGDQSASIFWRAK